MNYSVIGIILLFLAFLIGYLIGVAFAGPVMMKHRKIGTLQIDDRDPEKTNYLFRFDVDPKDIPGDDYISIKTETVDFGVYMEDRR